MCRRGTHEANQIQRSPCDTPRVGADRRVCSRARGRASASGRKPFASRTDTPVRLYTTSAEGGHHFGVCPPGETAAFDPFRIYNQELTIFGTMAVLNSYGPAIDVTRAGAIDAQTMVTHTLPLAQFTDGVELVRRGEGLKIQIDPSR